MVLFILLVILVLLCFISAFALYHYTFSAPADFSRRMHKEDYLHSQFLKKYYSEVKEFLYEVDEYEYKKVYIKSFDGLKLAARYYSFYPDAPIDIMFNGYKGCAVGDFCGIIPMSKRMGHNVLLADQRGTGDSEGKCQTFGIKERSDCKDWIRFVRKKFGPDTHVYLFGISMGAATVLMSCDDIPDNVKGIVSDCAYTSPKDIMLSVAKQRNLPGKLLYPFVRLGGLLFGGFDIEEASALEAVAHTNTPVCFIHGYEDRLVPYVMCGGLYDVCKADKVMHTFKRADHACSFFSNPERYEKVLRNFILNKDYSDLN